MSHYMSKLVSTLRIQAVRQKIGVWLFLTWILVVCVSYAYFMLRSVL